MLYGWDFILFVAAQRSHGTGFPSATEYPSRTLRNTEKLPPHAPSSTRTCHPSGEPGSTVVWLCSSRPLDTVQSCSAGFRTGADPFPNTPQHSSLGCSRKANPQPFRGKCASEQLSSGGGLGGGAGHSNGAIWSGPEHTCRNSSLFLWSLKEL